MNELTIIKPEDFGLKVENVKKIEDAFLPKIAERDGLTTIYKGLITKEISRDLCKEAGDLRRKLVKVRIGISDVHRTQKAFFLASGKFVDAWKNKETLPVTQMEEKLAEVEKHYEIEDQKIKDELQRQRESELLKYGFEPSCYLLCDMAEKHYLQLLETAKGNYEAKKAAERKEEQEQIDREKVDQIERDRVTKENEQLRKEAEKREKEIEIEKKKVLIKFKTIEEKTHKEREKIEDERRKIEAENQARIEAFKKEKEKIEAKQKAERLAPDKKKLELLAVRIVGIELPELKSKEAKDILRSVIELLNKTSNYIKEKTINL